MSPVSRARPYRKRESVAQPPRHPEGLTLEESQQWVRDVWEPWDANRKARENRRERAPRQSPSRAERDSAETEAAVIAAFIERAESRRQLALSDWAPEKSVDEIRARHGL